MKSRRVDVTIPTWQSAATLGPTLDAIRSDTTFPLGDIIVVDRASTDGTLEIAQRFGCVVLQDTVSLGSAREKAFARARSDWVALIDSDIRIHDGWFAAMDGYRSMTGVAGVQGSALAPFMLRPRPLEALRRQQFPTGPVPLAPGQRAYTNNTLVERARVKDLPLSQYEAYEDRAIGEAILAQGLTWLKVPVFVEHAFALRDEVAKCRWNAAGKRRAGFFRLEEEVRNTVYALKGGIVDAFRFRDPTFAAFGVATFTGTWLGYLRPTKYHVKHAASS